ncbi:hypothetical protein MHK_001218 [Candidatus Magnetomorum sp. HK-1]|nr:hypothetical protein MHK_001218 [Candidatus Magnetomorum sp. HK-1]
MQATNQTKQARNNNILKLIKQKEDWQITAENLNKLPDSLAAGYGLNQEISISKHLSGFNSPLK